MSDTYRFSVQVNGLEDLAGRLKRLRECEDHQARLALALREQATVLRSVRAAARRYGA